ncbi:MAG TPA: hypothetical protein VM533_08355 [Fimbriiglobus sp.]|jgi:hypothetical protein|nr:hypothetical protein [Fimbriiglobus sp.]
MSKRIPARTALVALAALAALWAAAGCGGEKRARTARVNGKVTYKGKAVPNGTVTFIPASGGPSATGEIAKDGTFSMTTYSSGDGAILGKHKVVIVAMQDMGEKLPEERVPLPPPIVPNRYTNPATSPLTAEVQDGENSPVFDLTD